jgi:hypothetical protein
MDSAAQTERIIRAVSNPYTITLDYEIDIEEVLAACAEHGVAVEINANPWRLDLDWRWHETALRLGCLMSINPDAHSTREIDLTHWGVEMARKGGMPKERVLNCVSKDELAEHLEKRRARRRDKKAPALRQVISARQLPRPRSGAPPAVPGSRRRRQSVPSLWNHHFAGRFPACPNSRRSDPWQARRTCRSCFTTR